MTSLAFKLAQNLKESKDELPAQFKMAPDKKKKLLRSLDGEGYKDKSLQDLLKHLAYHHSAIPEGSEDVQVLLEGRKEFLKYIRSSTDAPHTTLLILDDIEAQIKEYRTFILNRELPRKRKRKGIIFSSAGCEQVEYDEGDASSMLTGQAISHDSCGYMDLFGYKPTLFWDSVGRENHQASSISGRHTVFGTALLVDDYKDLTKEDFEKICRIADGFDYVDYRETCQKAMEKFLAEQD